LSKSREVVYDVRCYHGLIEALRSRVNELKVAYDTVDRVAGLPQRYTGKLLNPTNGRSLGAISLEPLLATLGLKILLVEDQQAYDRVKHRLEQRRWHAEKQKNTDGSLLTPSTQKRRAKRRSFLKGSSEWGRLMRARATIAASPEERSRRARHAVNCRWRRQASRRRQTAAVQPVAVAAPAPAQAAGGQE
jgi:hypothetical protein